MRANRIHRQGLNGHPKNLLHFGHQIYGLTTKMVSYSTRSSDKRDTCASRLV